MQGARFCYISFFYYTKHTHGVGISTSKTFSLSIKLHKILIQFLTCHFISGTVASRALSVFCVKSAAWAALGGRAQLFGALAERTRVVDGHLAAASRALHGSTVDRRNSPRRRRYNLNSILIFS